MLVFANSYLFSLGFLLTSQTQPILYTHTHARTPGGEAETYQGVKVTYVHGKTAVLTIYEDGKEREKIIMHTLKDRPAMHALMKEKGFKLKSEREVAKIYSERRAEEERFEKLKAQKREQVNKDIEQRRMERVAGRLGNDGKMLDARHETLTDLHKQRESEGDARALLRRKEKEKLIAMAGPSSSTSYLVSIVSAAALTGLTVMGIVSRRSKRLRGSAGGARK